MTVLFELDILMLEAFVALKKVAEKVDRAKERGDLEGSQKEALQMRLDELDAMLCEIQDVVEQEVEEDIGNLFDYMLGDEEVAKLYEPSGHPGEKV
jgi:hypothetical protein